MLVSKKRDGTPYNYQEWLMVPIVYKRLFSKLLDKRLHTIGFFCWRFLMYYCLLVVFGIVGASLRYALGLLISIDQFPLATLMVNLLGCFLLAFISSLLTQLPYLANTVASAIGTGLVGSFTTFSTFALESTTLIQDSNYLSAIVYILASLLGGLFACVLGYKSSEGLLTWRKK